MAITNKDLDPSERVFVYDKYYSAVVGTGATSYLALLPFSAQVMSAAVKANGLSGSPVWSLSLQRNTSGGYTLIPLGATLTIVEGSTNAFQGFSVSLGNTLPNLGQAGDMIQLTTGAANTAVTTAVVNVVVKALQDVVVPNNLVVS